MNDDDLLRTLESGRPAELRALAAQALSGRTAPAVIGGLTRALSDASPLVRVSAAQALATSAANLLRGAAETILDDSAVDNATGVELLGSMIGTAGHVLWRTIADSSDAAARIRAAEILVSLPHDRAIGFLRDMLDEGEPDATTAAAVLAPLGDDAAIEHLETTVADESQPAETRLHGARGLLDCRSSSASQVVADALRDHELVLIWQSGWPVKTADLVDDARASDYAPLRAAAHAAMEHIVRGLEQAHDDNLERALDDLVSAADHEARIRGGQALCELDPDEAIEALGHLVDERFDDDSVQLCEVGVVLGAIDHVGALPLLLRLARHHDWYTRFLAVQGIGKHQDPTAAVALYDIASRHDERNEVRRAALKAIGELHEQYPGVVPALLVNVLGHAADPGGPDEQNSRLAGRLMAEFELLSVIVDLREGLLDDRPTVRRSAAWALGEMSAEAGLADLIRLVRFDIDVRVRRAGAWALGRIGDGDRQLSTLIDALLRDEPAVRDQAALSLGDLRLDAAAHALREALTSPQSADVMDRVVWAVGELKDEEAIPQLLLLLVDGDDLVRRRCAEVLGRIGSPVAGDLLGQRVTAETDPDVRTAVLHALGELAWVDARQAVERAAEDPQSATVRRAAAQVLGRIGNRKSLQRLRIMVRADRDKSVREAAQAACERLLDRLPPSDDDRGADDDDQAAA